MKPLPKTFWLAKHELNQSFNKKELRSFSTATVYQDELYTTHINVRWNNKEELQYGPYLEKDIETVVYPYKKITGNPARVLAQYLDYKNHLHPHALNIAKLYFPQVRYVDLTLMLDCMSHRKAENITLKVLEVVEGKGKWVLSYFTHEDRDYPLDATYVNFKTGEEDGNK